jgi:hypothetical protein
MIGSLSLQESTKISNLVFVLVGQALGPLDFHLLLLGLSIVVFPHPELPLADPSF